MGDVIPIEIRPGHVVYIAGIPLDLTKGEADKLARVIVAFVLPSQPGDAAQSQDSGRE